MARSSLRLTIDKGPNAGETLACNPGTVIRVGRVLKGNTLTIRDPGISQKHLTVCFLPEISRWVVTDLGTSNGTHMNGCLITPDEPSPLSDGDVIKIGEITSISVSIFAPVDQPLVLPRSDRPPRPPKKVNLEDKEWEKSEDERSKNGRIKRGRGRKGGRSTRFSSRDEALESVLVEPRVTRSMAKCNSARVFVKKLKEEDVMMMSNSEFVEVMENEKQSNEDNAGVEEEEVAVDGENNSRVEEVKNNNMYIISKENNTRVEAEVLTVDGENNSSVEEVEDNMDNISKENNTGVEEEVLTVDGKNKSRFEEVEDNMNNMTLGEWFDRIEEYLPKSINKFAEEIIDKLREKAQFFDEYVSQTSNVLVE